MKTDESQTNKQTNQQTKTKPNAKRRQTSWERETLKCLTLNVLSIYSCKHIRFFCLRGQWISFSHMQYVTDLKSKFFIGFAIAATAAIFLPFFSVSNRNNALHTKWNVSRVWFMLYVNDVRWCESAMNSCLCLCENAIFTIHTVKICVTTIYVWSPICE